MNSIKPKDCPKCGTKESLKWIGYRNKWPPIDEDGNIHEVISAIWKWRCEVCKYTEETE